MHRSQAPPPPPLESPPPDTDSTRSAAGGKGRSVGGGSGRARRGQTSTLAARPPGCPEPPGQGYSCVCGGGGGGKESSALESSRHGTHKMTAGLCRHRLPGDPTDPLEHSTHTAWLLPPQCSTQLHTALQCSTLHYTTLHYTTTQWHQPSPQATTLPTHPPTCHAAKVLPK
jgi:hypothetical protein